MAAMMMRMKMMQTVSTTRILRGYSQKKATSSRALSRSGYITRLQDRPALCRLLSSGSSSDENLEDGSVAGTSPPQQQKRPPKRRVDPMAKRPTFRCDPYGQGGKPMSWMEAEALLATLHSDWKLVATPGTATTAAAGDTRKFPPHALERDFLPTDFLSGARLVQKLATVAQLDNHFPACLQLARKIVRKEWQVVTQVQCHTTVLGGLSTSDFHLAMLMDVEADRPEVKSLLLSQK